MFSTVRPAYLDDATAVFHMLRNFGSSLFISISVAVGLQSTFINSVELGMPLSEFAKVFAMPWAIGNVDIKPDDEIALFPPVSGG